MKEAVHLQESRSEQLVSTYLFLGLYKDTQGYKESLILLLCPSAFPGQVAGGSQVSALIIDTIQEAISLKKRTERLI